MKRVRRALVIASRVAGFGCWLFAQRLLGRQRGQEGPRRFARLLEGLGTPFVKLGQHLSLRTDLLPAEYIGALNDLQDHVATFDPAEAVQRIEAALGRPIGELFARFDLEPFAAASIAQVHAARLHDGREVIVKVRRPGIAERMDEDLSLLQLVVRGLSLVSPVLRRNHAADVVRHVWRNLAREMDLREEARNVRRFAEAFAASEAIMIPDVVPEMCTGDVMVQQRSGGGRVDAVADRALGARIARHFVDAYVHQFFSLGFFHGDPHPGNLFVMADGRLCFHDFGIVGSLDRSSRQALASFTLAFAEQDSDWIVESWMELGMLGEAARAAEIRPVIDEILADCARRPLKEWSMGAAFMRLVESSRGAGVRVPMNLLVLARTVLLMEATVRMLDPEFSLLDALLERSGEVLATSAGSESAGAMRLRYETAIAGTEWRRLLAASVRHFRQSGFRLQVDHEGLPQLGGTHLRAANRVSFSLIALGLYLAASLLMQHSVGPQFGGVPILATAGYAAALWLSGRLIAAVGKGL